MWITNYENSDPVLEFLSEDVSTSDFLKVSSTDGSVVEHVSTAVSDVHNLMIYLNCPDKTLSAWSCPSMYPISSTSDRFTGQVFLLRVFLFDFYQFLIGLLEGDSFLVSPYLLFFFILCNVLIRTLRGIEDTSC